MLARQLMKLSQPHSEDIEMANLGLLARPGGKAHMEKMTEHGCDIHCFTTSFRQNFYLGCIEQLDSRREFDIVLLKDRLSKNRLHGTTLGELADVVEYPALQHSGEIYIYKLIEYRERRKQCEEAKQAIKDAHNGKFELSDSPRVTLSHALKTYVRPASEFIKVDLPERATLVDPLIHEGDLMIIASDTGVGKTWCGTEFGSAIQNGRKAFGLWEVKTRVPTLYVDGEQHWSDTKKIVRFSGLGEGHVLSKNELEYYDVKPSLNLNEADVRELLFKCIIDNGYKFVVLDNLYSLWTGLDMDSAQEWHESNQWLMRLRSRGTAVLILHHNNKAGTQIGSISKYYNINTALVLKGITPKPVNMKGEELVSFRIRVEKMRMKAKPFDDVVFTCDDGAWTTSIMQNTKQESKTRTILLLLLEGIFTQKQIGNLLECHKSLVSKVKNSGEYKSYLNPQGYLNNQGRKLLDENADYLRSLHGLFNEVN